MFVITDVRPSEAETMPATSFCAVRNCTALPEDNLPSLEEWLFDGCGVEEKRGGPHRKMGDCTFALAIM